MAHLLKKFLHKIQNSLKQTAAWTSVQVQTKTCVWQPHGWLNQARMRTGLIQDLAWMFIRVERETRFFSRYLGVLVQLSCLTTLCSVDFLFLPCGCCVLLDLCLFFFFYFRKKTFSSVLALCWLFVRLLLVLFQIVLCGLEGVSLGTLAPSVHLSIMRHVASGCSSSPRQFVFFLRCLRHFKVSETLLFVLELVF